MKFTNPFKTSPKTSPMSDETIQSESAETSTESAPAQEAAPKAELSAEEKHASEIAILEAKVSDLQHKIILGLSDYQNLARIGRENEKRARNEQTRNLAQSLAGVLDHFDQALKIDAAQASAADVLAGVSMVHGELVKVLASFGVDRIEAKPGDAFDANMHQALMKMKVEGVKEGAIAMCFQTGYRLGEMVIRPAQVAVAE